MQKDWREHDWSDVEAIPIATEPRHVAQIAYSEDFKEAISLFHAIVRVQELSERALALTAGIIKMNPAHYSVWDYRLDICKAIGNKVFDYHEVGLTPSATAAPPIGEDGDWLNITTLANAKNYQVWNYRQHLLDPHNSQWYKGERVLVEMALDDDAKNFHAWSHFKWVIGESLKLLPKAFDPLDLLQQSEKMLKTDVFNNSVWSFRYFILEHYSASLNSSVEIEYVFNRIAVAPTNESAWVYLVGFVSQLSPGAKYEAVKRARVFADANEARGIEFLGEMSDAAEGEQYWNRLAQIEPQRKEYWTSRISA